MCKYCIFSMDWTSRISYVHIGQYYYYYYLSVLHVGYFVSSCSIFKTFTVAADLLRSQQLASKVDMML